MNRSLPLALLSLALVSTAAAQRPRAFDGDPVWNPTVDDAGCDEGVALLLRSADPGRPAAHRTPAPTQDRAEANRALIQQAYADLGRGDVPAVLALLDAHVTWTEAEGYPYAGTYVGPGTVAERVFARIGAEWDPYEAVPAAFIADGSRVVVLGEYRATCTATGRSVTAPFAHVWQVLDDTVVSFRQFTDGPPWQRALTP